MHGMEENIWKVPYNAQFFRILMNTRKAIEFGSIVIYMHQYHWSASASIYAIAKRWHRYNGWEWKWRWGGFRGLRLFVLHPTNFHSSFCSRIWPDTGGWYWKLWSFDTLFCIVLKLFSPFGNLFLCFPEVCAFFSQKEPLKKLFVVPVPIHSIVKYFSWSGCIRLFSFSYHLQ